MPSHLRLGTSRFRPFDISDVVKVKRLNSRAISTGLQTLGLLVISILLLARCWVPDQDSAITPLGRSLLDIGGRAAPCAGVSKVAERDRCAFVEKHCHSGSLIDYLHVYYCRVAPAGWLATLGFQVLCLFVMGLLFRVLSTTAEDYFSPILTQMSKDFYLPPRLAGVTLMAWGNGAPDIFSSMAAVKEGEYQLALGGQLGAGMFIGTVVLGAVLGASRGATMRGALLRDVSSYMLAVALVAWIIGSGKVTRGKALLLLGGYVVYVLAVCAADVTHRVRQRSQAPSEFETEDAKDLEVGLLTPPDSPSYSPTLQQPGALPPVAELPPPAQQLSKQASGSNGALSGSDGSCIELQMQSASEITGHRQSQPGDALPAAHIVARRAASVGGDTLLPAPAVRGANRHRQSPASALSPPLSYADMIHMPGSKYRERTWVALSDSPSFRRSRAEREDAASAALAAAADAPGAAYRPPGLRTRASVDNCFLESAIDAPAAASAGATANQRSAAPSAPSAAAPADAAATWLADDAAAVTPAAAPQPAELPPTECSGGGSGSSDRVLRRSASRWLQAAHSGSLRMFVEQQLLQRVLTAITVLEWPLTIARRATIPLLEQECYSRPWLIASMVGGPIATAIYFSSGLAGIVVAALIGIAAAAAAWYTTRDAAAKECPPDWDCGTGVPIGAVAVALAGFAVACMWIDTVASELVGLLRFFGVLARISSLVLGLTVLAWGNSIPDFITDVAMARAGFGNMAITACFAGPLCNIMNGLGVGFLLLVDRNGGKAIDVVLSTPVLTDAILVVGNCALVLAVGLVHRGHLPARAALLLTCLYGLYLVINIVVHYV